MFTKNNLVHLLLVGIFLLVLGLVGGVTYERLGTTPHSFSESPTVAKEAFNQDYYQGRTFAIEPCSYFQCLFNASGQIVGYANLKGYYQATLATGGGEENLYKNETQTCDRFVIIGGSKPLIDQFQMRIKQGNTLNKIVNGNLIINLDLGDPNLSSVVVKHIRASTPGQPISLGVLQEFIGGKGANPCTSTIRILNENQTLNS